MAEAAPLQASAARSPPVKQEIMSFDETGFSLPAEFAMKRPLENADNLDDNPDSKRLKKDDSMEDSFENSMELLVSNALSGFDDLIGQLTEEPNATPLVPTTEAAPLATATPADPMDVEDTPTPMPLPNGQNSSVTFSLEPDRYLRKSNVYALGSTAISILLVLFQDPPGEGIQKIRDPGSNHERSFRLLQQAFETSRRIYSPDSILVADDPDLQEPDARIITRLSNFAQIAIWLVENTLSSLREVDRHLLAVLRDDNETVSQRSAKMYTCLKSLLAIEALQAGQPGKSPEEVLDEVFGNELESALREQRFGLELTQSELGMLEYFQARKDKLRKLATENGDLAAEKANYTSDILLSELGTYAKHQLSSAVDIGQKLGIDVPVTETTILAEPEAFLSGDNNVENIDLGDLSAFFEKTTSGLVESALAGFTDEAMNLVPIENGGDAAANTPGNAPKPEPAAAQRTADVTDYEQLNALVAESTSNYVRTTLNGLSPAPYQPTVPISTAENMAAQSNYLSHLQQNHAQQQYHSFQQNAADTQNQNGANHEALPPNQSCSTAMLYDKAKQAALSKTTTHPRREGLHSTRRPWSQDEEKALMAGLDMVQGPHWSAILGFFGEGGTISDILKDRTQVQLKDKARNLKLFFLKTNTEMPYYLRAVTGELKTRAPGQAARKEAEERAKVNAEENQAKLQGIMALAGGLKDQPQTPNKAVANPATAVTNSVVSPAHAAAHAAASGQHGAPARPSVAAPSAGPLAGAYNRAGAQVTGQQNLQSVAQAPPRPQTQLPPQVPRPQPQTTAQNAAQQVPQQMATPQRPYIGPQTNLQPSQQPVARPPLSVQPATMAAQQAASAPTNGSPSPNTTGSQVQGQHSQQASHSPIPQHKTDHQQQQQLASTQPQASEAAVKASSPIPQDSESNRIDNTEAILFQRLREVTGATN